MSSISLTLTRDVVQSGRTLALGARGRWFESSHLDNFYRPMGRVRLTTVPRHSIVKLFYHYLYLSSILIYKPMTKLSLILSMLKWLLYPRYIDLRLYTMYGSRYYIYIARHPILFIQDINHYLDWCINMDKHR